MSRSVIAVLAGLLAVAACAHAQNNPRIGCIVPAGGRQGTELEVTVNGQYLDGVNAARVSGAGVRAYIVEHVKPMSQGQASDLRDKLRTLEAKRQAAAGPGAATQPAYTPADARAVAEIRRKLATASRSRTVAPALAEMVTLHVSIAADAAPGLRELRLGTSSGVSNPMVFCVGQQPEFIEEETGSGPSETAITLPAIVNGRIMPGDQDRFRFKARKGQRLVVATSARELIPYLADGVPGWFQATVSLFDSKGHELAYVDDYGFQPDPVLFYRIPEDGEYSVEIRDAIYRGREDFVYRIAIGELPFITSIFPLGGRLGAQTSVDARGWNFPNATLVPDARGPGIQRLFVRNEDVLSNRVPFAVDTLPECMDAEPNNTPEDAQKLELPIIINGRINYPRDWDVFCFEGKSGDQLIMEVQARRLNSPLDSLLKVTDASGKRIAFNDDHEDKGAGLITHQADSLLSVTLPANGAYFVHLGDTQRKGGQGYAYRLRIGPPRPDFQLRVVPSSISVRGGATIPITVFALRRDGFNGDIAIALKDAPKGYSLSGAWVPGNQDHVRLTLTAPMTTTRVPIDLAFEGRAKIGSAEVVRPAVPAEDMMQAFAYRHLVPSQELKVMVAGRTSTRTGMKIAGTTTVKIVAGGTGRLEAEVPDAAGAMQCELSEPPEGITIRKATAADGRIEIELECDGVKAKPGLKGNLLINVFAAPAQPAGENAQPAQRGLPLGLMPAIPFEVVGQ